MKDKIPKDEVQNENNLDHYRKFKVSEVGKWGEETAGTALQRFGLRKRL